MAKSTSFETVVTPKTLILGIDILDKRNKQIQEYFDEFLSLVKTHGTALTYQLFIKLRTIDPAYFVTTGKLNEIKQYCQQNGISGVILSESISPQQERNLSDYLECNVTDRTRLILEIFHNAARSAEGKTQVAIAFLQYEKTRLAGKGVHLAQQLGAVGARGGPGETLKERERRHIELAINKLKKQLDNIQQVRATQRKKRQSSNLPQLCLIGYTNAGKSTILNGLTKSNVLAEDKLFATLDTTVRELFIDGTKQALLSDTVGFIQNLPTRLIDAFKSTLEELHYADLLLHVIDTSNTNWQAHIQVVHELLRDLGVDKEMVYVFNKIDKAPAADDERFNAYQPHVLISATSAKGLQPLVDFLRTWLSANKTKSLTQ